MPMHPTHNRSFRGGCFWTFGLHCIISCADTGKWFSHHVHGLCIGLPRHIFGGGPNLLTQFFMSFSTQDNKCKESQTICSGDYVNLMVMTYWCRQKFDRLVTYHRIHKGRYFLTYICF